LVLTPYGKLSIRGKNHLTEALGHEACRKGYEVLYRRTAVPMDWIQSGLGYGAHLKRLKQVGSVQLLILDDFGFTPLSEPRQADLYELICERYEKHSTILTSNRLCGAPHKRFNAE
jgi:DNA replication protein DnaC